MSKKQRIISAVIFLVLIIGLIIGISLVGGTGTEEETINEVMRDAVLHETKKISLFGLIEVNPGLISAYVVTAFMIIAAIIIRIFVIPKFTIKPGKFQYVLEKGVGYFSNLATDSSPHRHQFMEAYIFAAGLYIGISTLFELLGLQATASNGMSVTLPAPLSDINAAIAMGVLSYAVILFGGLISAGPKGMLTALKDFSLPISMSFRLFGALLSGALTMELVYYYEMTSYFLPVIVGIIFTLLHAIIQAYVLTMLVAMFYGESTERKPKKPKQPKKEKQKKEVVS